MNRCWTACVLLATGLLPGCASQNRITLEQPAAPPSQRNIKLSGDWTYLDSKGQRLSSLLAFPLPGAIDGPRDFVIYLDLPAGNANPQIGGDGPEVGRGFLLQLVGERKGKTVFQAGTVKLAEVLLKPGHRRLDLDVRGEDGTHVTGRALLLPVPMEVQKFEQRYAADVAMLNPTTQPAVAVDETVKAAGGG